VNTMRQLILQSILAAAVIQAAPTGNLQAKTSSQSAVLYFRFGVEDGMEKEMAISYTNATGVTATLQMEVVDKDGKSIPVPYDAVNGGTATHTQLVTEVKPYAAGIYSTNAQSSPFRHGWLRVTSKPAGAITVSVHARYRRPGESEQHYYTLQALRPRPMQLIGPFDNGSLDQYLIANTGSQSDTVTLIARARDGVERCRANTSIRPGAFQKEAMNVLLPCTGNSRGMLEVRSSTGATAAMVFVLPSKGGTIPLHPAFVDATPSVDDQILDIVDRIKRSLGLN
jgi:hypothetical protein